MQAHGDSSPDPRARAGASFGHLFIAAGFRSCYFAHCYRRQILYWHVSVCYSHSFNFTLRQIALLGRAPSRQALQGVPAYRPRGQRCRLRAVDEKKVEEDKKSSSDDVPDTLRTSESQAETRWEPGLSCLFPTPLTQREAFTKLHGPKSIHKRLCVSSACAVPMRPAPAAVALTRPGLTGKRRRGKTWT